MHINQMTPDVTLGQTHYNPERGAFEAEARLQEAGAVFIYRALCPAAPHAEFDVVTRGLKKQALLMHRHAEERTKRLIRDTVRAAFARARPLSLNAAETRRIGDILAA